jgi:uncharacterized protein (TIGR03435 family)
MADLCTKLSWAMDRDVIDRTGLRGTFNLHLNLSPADIAFGAGRRGVGFAQDPAAVADEPGGSIPAALRQLGLRLESEKASAEFLTIDRVEMPNEN